MKEKLEGLAAEVGEKALQTAQNNKISVAFTLTALDDKVFKPNNVNATFFGSYLFHRRVSGVRVCANSQGKVSKVGNSTFVNYGTHCDNYPSLPYFTSAAAIGQKRSEIDVYIQRLSDAFKHF